MKISNNTNTNLQKNRFFKSPWLEAVIMVGTLILSFIALFIISIQSKTPVDGGMATSTILGYLVGFFSLSFSIAIIAVLGGIGGGVLFTPIMLAFTPVDSLIIRATGLIVAMFSGVIRTGIFMKKGLGNLKLCTLLAASQGIGALIGAQAAIYIYQYLGKEGEGFIRLILGIILALISVYFLTGGKKLEYPQINKVDKFSEKLNLSQSYYEESEGKTIDYKLTHAKLGLFMTLFVGIIGGFFGMGGGWAITPVQNFIMGAPLKVAAANSGIILGMVDSIGVWPYILIGAIIPLFILPWISGQVIGGYIGSLLLVKIKVNIIRLILIGIMFFTSFGLISKSFELFGIIQAVPPTVSISVLLIICILVIVSIIRSKGGSSNATKK